MTHFRNSSRRPSLFTDPGTPLAVLAVLALLLAGAVPALAEDAADDGESPKTYRNYLRWTTASEEENFGFDVYRSESEDGPFERLTDKPILGAGTTNEPSKYEFVDEAVDPYTTYYYYVESITMTGERERFSPIVRKEAKLGREPAESEDGGEPSADDSGP